MLRKVLVPDLVSLTEAWLTWLSIKSISASAYLQPALVPAPTIPRRFVDNGSIDPAVTGHRASEPEPQLSAYVLSATCDLSEKLYEAMAGYGSTGADSRIRQYQDLRQWSNDMPSLVRADTNFCPETCLLRWVSAVFHIPYNVCPAS